MTIRRISRYLLSAFMVMTIIQLGECAGTCKDMMSVGAKTVIDHGVMKTAAGDLKTGLVLQDAIKANDNVYFVHIRPICKIKDVYKYNCLAVKTFASYNELKTNNQKACWDKEVIISAQCRLSTIRIANGDMFCELETTNSNRKPRLAKISLSKGKVLKNVVLSKAVEIANCLKPRENYWGYDCRGEVYFFSVHTYIDQKRLFVLYQSKSNKAKSIIEERSMTDLSLISEKEIDKIASETYSLLVCGKLYELAVSSNTLYIKQAVDIMNPTNQFKHHVTLIKNLPDASHSWVHYNDRKNEIFLGSPNRDSLVFKVTSCEYPYGNTKNMDFSKLKSTMLWSLEPTEYSQETEMINSMESYYKLKDPKTLLYISNNLLKCPPTICADIHNQKKRYCTVKDLAVSLDSYAHFRQIKPASRKRLITHFDMSTLLQQQTYKTMASKMNSLQSFISKNFMDLKKQVNFLGSDIGNYFNALADFDQRKAEGDLKKIQTGLTYYAKELNSTGKKIEDRLQALFKTSVATNVADIAEYAVHIGVAASAFANPIECAVSTAVSALNLVKSIDLMANAIAKVAQTAKLKTYFEDLALMAKEFKKNINKNNEKYQKITLLLRKGANKTLSEEDLVAYGRNFLAEYRSYRPSFNPANIAKYGALLKNVIKGFCDIITKSKTATGAAIKTATYARGDCFDANLNAELIVSILKIIQSNQAALMDVLVSAVRSAIARSNAQRIATERFSISNKAVTENYLNLKIHALSLFVFSEVHRLMLVHEACALSEYRNGGSMSDDCRSAIANPQGQSFNKLIATKFNQDMCSSDDITKHVYIPAMEHSPSSAIPSGTIDLTELYKEKRTFFQVPSKKWLVDNRWIHQHEVNKMIILKEFELFLPMIQNTTTATPIKVTSSFRLEGMNSITPGGTQYDFSTSSSYNYNFRYSQNTHLCASPLQGNLPYHVPGCKKGPSVCLISKGTVRKSVFYPSVYAKWSVKASIKGTLRQPKPKGKFYLVASAKFCLINPIGSTKRETKREDNQADLGTASSLKVKRATCCATEKKYLDFKTNQCQSCPADSKAELNGYYCEKTTK